MRGLNKERKMKTKAYAVISELIEFLNGDRILLECSLLDFAGTNHYI